ncbi:ABC transporter permease subunit [Pseudomonas citronellolis]|jgi:glycine betaine/proline transport system permease protein|uniref:ABC transporter permease subunit n=1 Tax=Pseudomonas citronellolis TaxID=53408 RepID=UPI00248DFB31|nr:ABC transporter permease subunit [Pseudomonas citronellolis]
MSASEKIPNPFDYVSIPLGQWVASGVDWTAEHFRPFFQVARVPIDFMLNGIESTLLSVPPLVMLIFLGLLGWQISGPRLGLTLFALMFGVGAIGGWDPAMTTLALVITSVLLCIFIGIPLGILMAKSDRLESLARPILDGMQTIPAFVYLVPIVMIMGIGNVPGVIVTIVFAMPPLIRLTSLGIRQVPSEVTEAGSAFGASPLQMLVKIQLPMASRTIMAGVNQTLMLSLSMVVIASMISVGGLGLMVLRGIGRLDMGIAAVGGVGIVLLAIMLDRLTQELSKPFEKSGRKHWYEGGFIGLIMACFKFKKTSTGF